MSKEVCVQAHLQNFTYCARACTWHFHRHWCDKQPLSASLHGRRLVNLQKMPGFIAGQHCQYQSHVVTLQYVQWLACNTAQQNEVLTQKLNSHYYFLTQWNLNNMITVYLNFKMLRICKKSCKMYDEFSFGMTWILYWATTGSTNLWAATKLFTVGRVWLWCVAAKWHIKYWTFHDPGQELRSCKALTVTCTEPWIDMQRNKWKVLHILQVYTWHNAKGMKVQKAVKNIFN